MVGKFLRHDLERGPNIDTADSDEAITLATRTDQLKTCNAMLHKHAPDLLSEAPNSSYEIAPRSRPLTKRATSKVHLGPISRIDVLPSCQARCHVAIVT